MYVADCQQRLLRHLATGNQRREDVYEECQKYPFINNDLWQDKIAKLENINVPVYVVASYSNVLHTDGTFRGWRGISSKDKWLRIHDNLEWPDYYNPKYIEDRRRFYDHFLKGIDNGWEKTPHVRYTLHDMEGVDNPNGGYYPNTFYKPDNHGRHIIHCGGKYQSYLQIGVLK